jgi:hypothetical protein
MLYVDYNFDLSDDAIIFDSELRLKEQSNENKWGSLPAAWKDGDLFMLKVSENGRVVLHRKPDAL